MLKSNVCTGPKFPGHAYRMQSPAFCLYVYLLGGQGKLPATCSAVRHCILQSLEHCLPGFKLTSEIFIAITYYVVQPIVMNVTTENNILWDF